MNECSSLFLILCLVSNYKENISCPINMWEKKINSASYFLCVDAKINRCFWKLLSLLNWGVKKMLISVYFD